MYAGDELILLCYVLLMGFVKVAFCRLTCLIYTVYNSYAHENIINCDVLQHDNVNNSDHVGVMCELCVECPDAPVDGLKDARKNQRRPKWEDAEFRTTYLQSLRSALASIRRDAPSNECGNCAYHH